MPDPTREGRELTMDSLTIDSYAWTDKQTFVEDVRLLHNSTHNKSPSRECYVMIIELVEAYMRNDDGNKMDGLMNIYDKYVDVTDKPLWNSFRDNQLKRLSVTTADDGRKDLRKNDRLFPSSDRLYQLSMEKLPKILMSILSEKKKQKKLKQKDLINALYQHFQKENIIANATVLSLLIPDNANAAIDPLSNMSHDNAGRRRHRKSVSEPTLVEDKDLSSRTIQPVETHSSRRYNYTARSALLRSRKPQTPFELAIEILHQENMASKRRGLILQQNRTVQQQNQIVQKQNQEVMRQTAMIMEEDVASRRIRGEVFKMLQRTVLQQNQTAQKQNQEAMRQTAMIKEADVASRRMRCEVLQMIRNRDLW